jgi:predicted metal-binding membrane protein
VKVPESVVVFAVYLGFWALMTVLAVGGYDLLIAHAFRAPLIDWAGGIGAYLLLLSIALPEYSMRSPQVQQQVKVKR